MRVQENCLRQAASVGLAIIRLSADRRESSLGFGVAIEVPQDDRALLLMSRTFL
jgi:hypothetical protein